MPDLGALVDSSMNKLASFEDRINSSTFGRVFRLDGSGHVSQNCLFYLQLLNSTSSPRIDVLNRRHPSMSRGYLDFASLRRSMELTIISPKRSVAPLSFERFVPV